MNMNMHYNALQREKDVIFSLIYICAPHTFPSNLSRLVFCLISLTKETVTHLPASSVSGRFVRN